MEPKKFLLRIVTLIVFIFILNLLAMKFHWYSSIWYLDMPMHFLGGVWIAFAIAWLFKIKDATFNSLLKIFSFCLLIGVLWELFEIIVSYLITKNEFNLLDTISDLFFDLAGCFFGILYLMKKNIITITENKI